MRDLRGTKDEHEREETEAERLVRSQPKAKPPRRDLRREEMEVDRDPDTDSDPDLKGDPDMSVNYKSVGGSVEDRVLGRFIEAKSNPKYQQRGKERKQQKRQEALKKRPAQQSGPKKYVSVFDSDAKRVVSVPEQTAKNNPSRYKPVKDKGAPEEKPAGQPAAPAPAEKPEAEKGNLSPEDQKELDSLTRVTDAFAKNPDWKKLPPETPLTDLKGLDPEVAKRFKTLDGLRKWDAPEWMGEHLDAREQAAKEGKPSPNPTKPAEQEAPKAAPDKEGPKSEPVNDATKHAENAWHLKELGEQNPSFAARMKSFFNTDVGRMAKPQKAGVPGNPDLPAQAFYPDVKLPPSIKTIGDLADALGAKPAKPAAPKPAGAEKQDAAGKKQDGGSEKKTEESPATGSPESESKTSPLDGLPEEHRKFLEGIVKKHVKDQAESSKPKTVDDALGGVDPNTLPEPYKSAILAEQAKNKPKPKDEGEKKPEKKPKEDPWPGRRKVDKAEVSQAQALIAKTLPAKLAAKFINMHPDDAVRLASTFKGMKSLGPFSGTDDFKGSMERLKKSFTLDPESIGPPKTWKTKKGEIPFEKLTPAAQEKALSIHRSQVLAYGLATRERAIETLANKGLSRAAAAASVDLSLSKQPTPKTAKDNEAYHEERAAKVRQAAQDHFIAEASSDDPPMSPTERSAAIETASSFLDSDAQKISLAKVQANDLRDISEKYLVAPEKGFSRVISDRDSTKKIIAKLNSASEDFDKLARDYPKDVRTDNPDPKKVFQAKVLSRLKSADPAKHAEIQQHIAKQEKVDYDKKKAQFETDTEKFAKEHSDYEKRFEKWSARKEKAESGENGEEPFRETPKTSSFDEPPPAPPMKPIPPKMPAGYYEAAHDEETPSIRKSRNQLRDVEKRLGLDDGGKRKTSSLYSSYGYRDLTMGTPMQPSIGTRQASVLAGAQTWLKSAVLSKTIDGMPADARFRAALDLAIRDVPGHEINAATYNDMLSKLSVGHQEQLGTIYGKESFLVTEVRTFAARVARLDPALAYQLLDFADAPAVPAPVPGPQPTVVVKQAASDDTYAALRATVIRVASERPTAREQLLPVLRLIKTIDDVRALRTASGD